MSHPDISFAVDDEHGIEHVYDSFDEAAAFALKVAVSQGESELDVLVFSEEGADAYGGDDAVAQFNEDPEASVFERLEIQVNNVGRVP